MNLFILVTLVLLLLHGVNCGLLSTTRDFTRSSSKTLRVHHAHDEDAETTRDYPRIRRATSSSDPSSVPTPKVEVIDLHDGHSTIQIDWSGKGSSDTMVILGIESGKTSSLHVSHDYGMNFTMVTLNVSDNQVGKVDYFVKGPVTSKLYVMVDIADRVLFVSTDDCYNFKNHNVTFVPTYVGFHPSLKVMLAYDSNTGIAYISSDDSDHDLGVTWKNSTTLFPGRRIKDAVWNPYKNNSLFFMVQQQNDTRLSEVYEVDTNFSHAELIQSGVLEFSVSDDYMFAVKDHPSNSESLVLLVSYKQKPFRQAQFPQSSEGQRLTEKSYYIADTSEQQVFVAVYHRKNLSNLYISEEEGISYSLSLDNVLFDDPALSNNYYNNLRALPSYKVIDFHKVEGLKGAYIASQINSQNKLESFITFDKGGVWQHLVPPSQTYDGHPVRCEWPDCSLHLASLFSLSRYYVSPIYTRESTPGIVMASGFLGTSLVDSTYNYNLYVSNTSGATWTEALSGKHYYQFGDFGSVLVAVKQDFGSGIDYFEYSLDEGATWYRHQFHNSTTFRTYGMLTEPGEATLVFGIYGADTSRWPHDWIIIRIDFSEILSNKCTKEDYYKWSPSDNLIDNECILGEKETFERKIANHSCLNGGEYERVINKAVCPCSREDYECDFGFEEDDGNTVCLPSDQYDVHWGIPYPCPAGNTYIISLGYRKIIGDKCVGGEERDFLPRNYVCPNVKDAVKLHNKYNASRKVPIVIGVGETVDFTASSIYFRNSISFIWYSSSDNYSINTTNATKSYTFNKAGMFFVTVGIYSNVSSIVDFNTVRVYDHLTADGFIVHANNTNPLVEEQISITAFLPDNDKLIYGDMKFQWFVDGQLWNNNHMQVLTVNFNTTQSHEIMVIANSSVSAVKQTTLIEVIDIRSHEFKVEVLGANAVQISWDQSKESQHILKYHIYYKATKSERDSLKLLVDLSPSIYTYITTVLEAGTEYQFQLKATVNNLIQPASEVVNITTEPNVPDSPQNVKISPLSPNSHNITWDPVNIPNVYYHVLIYSKNIDANAFVAEYSDNITDGTNYTHPLETSDVYTFQVIAIVQNSAGQKLVSKPSLFVSTDVNSYKPNKPRSLKPYVINSTCVRLMWTAPLISNTNTMQEVDSYTVVVYGPDHTVVYSGSTSDTQIMYCGLKADTQYSYKVRSVVVSDHTDSEPRTFKTFSYAPKAPSTVVVEALSDTSIKVSWKPPVTYVSNFIKGYKVQDDSHSVYAELAPSQYSVILYGLMPYEQYNFTVSVVYSSTNQYAAHWMMGATKEGIPDAAVCHDASDIVSTGATLSWIPPSHINGKLKQYEVVLHDPLGEIIPHYITTATSLPLTSLRPSTSYTFSVRAYNSEGVGPYCNEPLTFTTNGSGSTVEVEFVFEYPLVHTYSINEQAKMFIEQLIDVVSSNTGVNESVFTGPHLLHNTTTVMVRVVILPTKDKSSVAVANNLIGNCDNIAVFGQTAKECNRIVEPPVKGYSSEQENSDNHQEGLLITCVFISIAFNVLFLIIICFAFKRNRALAKSNRQLVTMEGLHYSRVNDRITIDEANINSNDTSSSSSSCPSPVNCNNNNDDDEPMIDL